MFRQKKLQQEQHRLQKETKNKKVFKYNAPNHRKVVRGVLCVVELVQTNRRFKGDVRVLWLYVNIWGYIRKNVAPLLCLEAF